MQTNTNKKPTTIKPARKLATTSKAAKAAKPVVPAAAAPLTGKAADRATAAAAITAFRTSSKAFYNGPSPVIHNRKPLPASEYIARIKTPVQTATVASQRDEALLAVIHSNNVNGVFNPVTLACDAGVISRLSSLGYIGMRGDQPTLTTTGRERAAIAAKRKA